MPRPIYLFSTSSHPDTVNINSLEIELLKPEIDFNQYDYLILTSKQAVEALKQYEKEQYIHMATVCVSTKTAEAYKKHGGSVVACGNGYGDDLRKLFTQFPHATRWLYLRAEVVASDFAAKAVEAGYAIDAKIVYKSRCAASFMHLDMPKDAVCIFTSPSSVECFLERNSFEEVMKIVVIGTTTAKLIPKSFQIHMPQETTIEACVALAKKLATS